MKSGKKCQKKVFIIFWGGGKNRKTIGEEKAVFPGGEGQKEKVFLNTKISDQTRKSKKKDKEKVKRKKKKKKKKLPSRKLEKKKEEENLKKKSSQKEKEKAFI